MSGYYLDTRYIFVGTQNEAIGMILDKLSKIKLEAENKINSEYRKIETVRNFKKLLNQIDFSSEVVPTEDTGRLKKL